MICTEMEVTGLSEPVFVNVYGAQESIPPAYVAWRAGTTNMVIAPARQAGNLFLGSLEGPQIRAQAALVHAAQVRATARAAA
jgi:hypothetical protein